MADDDTALQSVIKNNAQTHFKKSTLWFLLMLYMLINMLHKQIRLIKKNTFWCPALDQDFGGLISNTLLEKPPMGIQFG